MNISTLESDDLIVFECLSGSRAYGLDTSDSDTDIRGVFVLPQVQYYGLEYLSQVQNESHDVVYFELQKFIQLLLKGNPSALELAFSPDSCIRKRSEVMDFLKPEAFLSKQCEQTFAGYAMAQIKKAKGLNKKINQPELKERVTVLECCFVTEVGKTRRVQDWLKAQNKEQSECGLVNLPHMPNVYALYFGDYKGIVQKSETANDISLSSVPKGEIPVAYLYFNKELYKKRCREYKEYWTWVENRNEKRFEQTLNHGKQYDAKNMMHTHRLLDLAHDIATEKTLHLQSTSRDFLLQIKRGEFDYNELVAMAEEKMQALAPLFKESGLPESPDRDAAEFLVYRMRQCFYR